MWHDLLSAGKHDESTLLDFVVKERLSRVYEAVSDKVRITFHKSFNDAGASLFDIPFFDLMRQLSDFKADVHDFSYDDVYEYSTEFEDMPLHFFAVVGLFAAGAFSLSGTRAFVSPNLSEGEILMRIQNTYYPDIEEKDAGLVMEFYNAYKLYLSGDKAVAFKSSVFHEYCERLSYLFSPSGMYLPAEYAADNLSLIMSCFVDSTEDYFQRFIMYSSREVFLFKRYKHLLPENVREEAEAYLKVFENPSTSSEVTSVCNEYDGNTVVVLTEFMPALDMDCREPEEIEALDAANECTRYFNVFLEYSVKWLDKNLPVLRQEYCKKEVI